MRSEIIPIEDLVLCNLSYSAIGGVRREDIPEDYPEVLDRRLCGSDQKISENYYPDWSRTTFMDIRNVKSLTLENLRLHALEPDTREPYLLEGCTTLKREIHINHEPPARPVIRDLR